MDLRLRGRKAIVCAASQGLGKASAMTLAREGVELVIVARRRDVLDSAADEIESATANRPHTVAADVTSQEGREAILAACADPDILINNAGGPPPGDFRNFGRDDWIKALDGNMLAPIALIKATIDGMIARKFGRIVNITSHAVKAPVAMLALSNGARTGLTGFVAGLARSVSEHNVTVNNLLPGTFDTDRLKSNLAALARNSSRSVAEVTEEVRASNPSRRFGHPDEFGATCAFLCSTHAGYITGQNILIDGGAYPGTF
ncbi:SDR family oxidoreductase [Bradyrhizobium sp. CCGUVB23]|uniref:SDR family oxidoreductase n=1 Tax=Bradyrhizobium sp. CCGUVB23 TaxID=2949630 RepID=UPI0020B31835|nr:SDR family oxidoreductase [Bradyrhizobium sp. CCGUVB23]MCP3465490.1 SDR family oxidoreductase [Bradyrhizobium sp. CCGUVB23]